MRTNPHRGLLGATAELRSLTQRERGSMLGLMLMCAGGGWKKLMASACGA